MRLTITALIWLPLLPAAALGASSQATLADPLAIAGVVDIGHTSVLSGDFNGDGLMDICALDREASQSLYVSFGLGSRQFAPVQLVPTAAPLGQSLVTRGNSLEVGDVDGDGDDDIVGYNAGGIVLLISDGTGGFTEVPGPAVSNVRSIRLGDADGDGDLDVYYANQTGMFFTVTLYVAIQENGQFTGLVRTFSLNSAFIEVDDVDGDGIGDVHYATNVHAYRLLTAAGLGPEQVIAPSSIGPFSILASRLELADVNADGFLDALVTEFVTTTNNPETNVRLGSSTGIAATPTLTLDEPGARIRGFSEFNGDGFPDIYYADASGDLFVSYGSGALPYPMGVPMQNVWGVGIGDIDGDGRDDRAVSVDAGNAGGYAGQHVVYGVDNGFDPTTQPLLDQDIVDLAPVETIRALDIDGDGDLDLIGIKPQGGINFTLFENLGGLRFAVDTDAGTGFGLEDLRGLAVGDTDGDGRQEVLVSSEFSGGLRAYELHASGFLAPLGGPPLTGVTPSLVLDVDQDGFDDVVASGDTGIEIYRGQPGGPTTTPLVVPLPFTFRAEASFADVDGDGDLDMLTTGTDVDRLHENVSGGGTLAFAPALDLPVIVNPSQSNGALIAVDWDLDGLQDDLVVRGFTGISLYIGGSTLGSYAPPQRLLSAISDIPFRFEERMEAVDLDEDGDTDIVLTPVSIDGAVEAYVIYNDTLGGAPAPEPLSTGRDTRTTGVADLDGDGDADVFQIREPLETYVLENLATPRSGEEFCLPPVVNSSGQLGRLDIYGEPSPGGPALRLFASSLPRNVFGFFIGGPNVSAPLPLPNSLGTLCIGANLGRYQRPNEVQLSGDSGTMELFVGPDDLRSGAVLVPATQGLTWTFQAWHRDVVGGAQTSHLTSAVTVTFQ